MIINSTNKTRLNNYLDNTRNVAMVHVERTAEAGDPLSPFKVTIEGLTTVNNIIYQVIKSNGDISDDLGTYSIAGNVISFIDDVSFTNANGNVFSIFAFGT